MSFPRVRIGGVERGPFAVVVIGGSLVVVALSARTPWWVGVIVSAVLLTTVTVEVGGRTAARTLLDWAVYRSGRDARAWLLAYYPEIRDVEVAAGVCGVSGTDSTLVAMIQLAPDLDLPTIIAEKSIYTEDTVSTAMLLPMLDHFGISVDIDIVTTGQRIRPIGSYSMLYDQLVGRHPVVGHRLTWLVVRLDQMRNLHALTQRGSCAVVAPKALASAAHRIAHRLREYGFAAHALPSEAMLEATRLLHAGVELSELRETWRRMESPVPGRSVTSFLVDWNRLGGLTLDDCWTWNRGHTTLVVSLSGEATGPRALVRYVGPPLTGSPVDYLRPLSGRQSEALLASLPTPTSIRALPVEEWEDDTAPELLADLTVAIGPNGQILGSLTGQPRHTLALPLYDPARYNPRRRTIDVQAALPVAQQIVLRATAVGADVEVHSARPESWRQLVAAIGDPGSLRMAQDPSNGDSAGSEPDAPPVMIAVFDQVPARASSAHTTVTIRDPGGPRRQNADLTIEQVGDATVDVSIPMRTVRVDLIEPRGETRYLQPPMYAPDGLHTASGGELHGELPLAIPAPGSTVDPVPVPDTRYVN